MWKHTCLTCRACRYWCCCRQPRAVNIPPSGRRHTPNRHGLRPMPSRRTALSYRMSRLLSPRIPGQTADRPIDPV